ncbi:septal ring lytic transglycosylase RlpA family protein [Sphingomonas qomolangmaensis]|uniref:Endolytic peptidoglycan transglycosylase RlpA n=1 Tax=Sphingomonas qomolangmaensis TaxID=2918765 RepID=A0ABY5L9Q8_9SPHN|nr:septal ring lytic transglycosylase RlpA family protein [Sphingomonas qomolangmaensis]UUL82323.1 septal ring lytic transglycosylase RlpA family protein [Sphingomonas qomolangmaensis]
MHFTKRSIAAAGSVVLMLTATPAFAEDVAKPESPSVIEKVGEGLASFFGREIAGNRTASGEKCDPELMTAAHRTLPFGSLVRVTDALSGNSVIVRINDRGPFVKSRAIDLSKAAARELGIIGRGTAKVVLSLVAAK